MDISKLTHGAKVVLGAAIVYFIVLIPHWQDYHGFGFSGWHGIGVLCGLLVIALIAWQAVRLANINIEVGVTPSMVTAALAVLLLFFTVIKFLVANEFRTFWSWLGLALSIVIVVGAWMNMKAMGESITEMGSSMKAAAGSAAAAAKAATDKSPDEAAAPAPAPPAPAAPEAPAAPPAYTPPAPTPAPPAPHEHAGHDDTPAADDEPPATTY
jgi:cation transport ATPase